VASKVKGTNKIEDGKETEYVVCLVMGERNQGRLKREQ
jgi:hypothetical protein